MLVLFCCFSLYDFKVDAGAPGITFMFLQQHEGVDPWEHAGLWGWDLS